MPDRYVIRLMIPEREGQSDNFGLSWVETGGLQVEGKFSGLLQSGCECFKFRSPS